MIVYSSLVLFTPDFLLVSKKTPTCHWNPCSQLFVKEKLSYDQEFQVRKMEVLSLRLFWGWVFPLHKPYPYSWTIGEDSSILGIWKLFGDHIGILGYLGYVSGCFQMVAPLSYPKLPSRHQTPDPPFLSHFPDLAASNGLHPWLRQLLIGRHQPG